MPKYEYRSSGDVVERVHTRDGSNEDTRLGTAALDNASEADGWALEGAAPKTAEAKPSKPKAGK